MHLSSIDRPWGKPFTNKRYLHPPLAENVVTMWPSSMVLIGELPADDPQSWYEDPKFGSRYTCSLPSAGVIFTLKAQELPFFRQRNRSNYRRYLWDHDLMPYKETTYRTRKDGVPIHSFVKELDAVRFSEEAFCDSERVSTAYIRVTVENAFGLPQRVELGVLARSGHETLFTGCADPDGYDGYEPKREMWEELTPFKMSDGFLTDGVYRLYFDASQPFVSGGADDLDVVLELAPYEKRTFTFALTRSPNAPKAYETARRDALRFWKNELAKAQYIPDKNGVGPLFWSLLAQELQMFARPRGKEYTVMRQGATQRYHWPEAKEIIKALSHIGGYSDYIERGLDHYFNDLQEKDGDNAGRIHYKYVPWNSRTAAALEMFASAVRSDGGFFDKYIEQTMLGFRWMERERARSSSVAGATPGLFPPGVSTDNPFAQAQQWASADIPMLRGYAELLDVLRTRRSPYLAEVQAAYDDYFAALRGVFEKYAAEQSESEFLYLPRDPKNDPQLESGLNASDFFLYHMPPVVLAMGIAGYGTKDAEKLLMTYTRGGQSSHGLIQPMYRSVAGGGRTWYTTWAEHDLYCYFKKSGQHEKCGELLDALLRYNVTAEYYQAERYDDHDAYVSPWMPNASANGRVLDMLFDFYGKKAL